MTINKYYKSAYILLNDMHFALDEYLVNTLGQDWHDRLKQHNIESSWSNDFLACVHAARRFTKLHNCYANDTLKPKDRGKIPLTKILKDYRNEFAHADIQFCNNFSAKRYNIFTKNLMQLAQEIDNNEFLVLVENERTKILAKDFAESESNEVDYIDTQELRPYYTLGFDELSKAERDAYSVISFADEHQFDTMSVAEKIERLSNNSDELVRLTVAESNDTPEEILIRLLLDKTERIRKRAAKNSNLSEEKLVELFNNNNYDSVRISLVQNENFPISIVIDKYDIWDDGFDTADTPNVPRLSSSQKMALYNLRDGHPNTPVNMLVQSIDVNLQIFEHICQTSDKWELQYTTHNEDGTIAEHCNHLFDIVNSLKTVIHNPSCPIEKITELAEHKNSFIRSLAASSSRLPQKIVDKLAREHYVWIVFNVILNKNISNDALSKIAKYNVSDLILKTPKNETVNFDYAEEMVTENYHNMQDIDPLLNTIILKRNKIPREVLEIIANRDDLLDNDYGRDLKKKARLLLES